METLPAAAQDDSSGANPSSVKSDDSSPQHESGRGSPPPNCAICLGTCRNKSFTDSCFHQFCFKCLLTWSKVKAECPLCKQNFRSIIHNVRSNHQYEQYVVEQRQAEDPVERHTIDIDNLTTTRRFRYRTTLTLPRRESVAIQQLLLHYPMVADVLPAARVPPRRRSPASFRRTVYRHNLWARPLPDFTGRFRICSPMFFRYNDSQMHRLVPWLNRELHYLLNENVGHVAYVISRILELLPQHPITSTEFKEAMQRYFGERTEHFLHELYCFASTPYDLTGYDRNVQYTTDSRISTIINEVISSSESEASVDSDIVMVSSSEAAEPPPGPSRVPAPVYPQNYIAEPPSDNVIPIETLSGQSDTDDDSSEVMVVGYIKPPQDRTPEVVDLLGSDSDVIVQEGVAEGAGSAPREGGALVKLSLKRHRAREATDSEDSTYTPPSPPLRRRRRRSGASATTADTSRTTPSPAAAAPAPSWDTDSADEEGASSDDHSPPSSRTSPPPSSPSSTATSQSSGDASSASLSSGRRRRLHKRRPRRRAREPTPPPERPKPRRPTKRARKGRRPAAPANLDKEKSKKRKSDTGKGVKSSKKTSAAGEVRTAEAAVQAAFYDQPSTSGGDGRRAEQEAPRERKHDLRSGRETRRLRSVVSVINGRKNSGETNASGNAHSAHSAQYEDSEARERRTVITSLKKVSNVTSKSQCYSVIKKDENVSDSDDDLPLNLTVGQNYPYSLP